MKRSIYSGIAAALAVTGLLLLTACKSTRDHSNHQHHHSSSAKPYPLNTCLVTDEAFNHGKPYTFVHEGQEIKLCCEDCLQAFKESPKKYVQKLK